MEMNTTSSSWSHMSLSFLSLDEPRTCCIPLGCHSNASVGLEGWGGATHLSSLCICSSL